MIQIIMFDSIISPVFQLFLVTLHLDKYLFSRDLDAY